MTALPGRSLTAGHRLFAQYAFPPNELGYCGPEDTHALTGAGEDMTSVAREFDGAWPYLQEIADAAGIDDPLDADVVRSYWIGGPLLHRVDARSLISRLRVAFTGQTTGVLDDLDHRMRALAHHSFHVFVVYPWVRFLDGDPATPLRVLQNCRIRWGTVTSVDGDFVSMTSRPLAFDARRLGLGDAERERVRWSRDGRSLTSAPAVGTTVTAHWDWVCGSLDDLECDALASATQDTLDLVNAVRS